MQRPQRDIEDPITYAKLLLRKLRLEGDKGAFRDTEDIILEAMNEALAQAREAVVRNPRWGVEAIDALKARLNSPR